jgi:hypothetical protein
MKHGEVELEVEFSRDCPDSGSYLVHLRCFSILELERQSLSKATLSAPAQTQSANADFMAGERASQNGTRP